MSIILETSDTPGQSFFALEGDMLHMFMFAFKWQLTS